MQYARRAVLCGGLVAFCLLLGGGCTDGKLTIKGKLLDKGQPIKRESTDQVALTFYPEDAKEEEKGNGYPATVDTDGNFTVNGIPPGHYRVTFQLVNMGVKDKPGPPQFKYKGPYTNANTTPIKREVKSAGTLIEIDIAEAK
jgi:hypothetical protein